MAQQTIDIGSAPNDGTGDPIRDAFDKCNDNFTELYGSLAGLLDFQGATDCSANPNYPAASQGDIYIVSVAGKIGGASGKVVEVGDFYLALADNAGGTEASVGTSWAVLQANITGGSVISELDDIPDVNAPTPAAGDVLTWDDTPGEWVAQALPGAGAFVIGDATDVDTTGAASGNVLTYDGAQWEPVAPSGGAAWAELDYYDITASGAIASRVVDVTGYNELLILGLDVTLAGSGWRAVTLSDDGGATYYEASTDYDGISTTGTVSTGDVGLLMHSTASAAARIGQVHICNLQNGRSVVTALTPTRGTLVALFRTSSSPIDFIKIVGTTSSTTMTVTNMTGGQLIVYAR